MRRRPTPRRVATPSSSTDVQLPLAKSCRKLSASRPSDLSLRLTRASPPSISSSSSSGPAPSSPPHGATPARMSRSTPALPRSSSSSRASGSSDEMRASRAAAPCPLMKPGLASPSANMAGEAGGTFAAGSGKSWFEQEKEQREPSPMKCEPRLFSAIRGGIAIFGSHRRHE